MSAAGQASRGLLWRLAYPIKLQPADGIGQSTALVATVQALVQRAAALWWKQAGLASWSVLQRVRGS
jgi:hypothetical protein